MRRRDDNDLRVCALRCKRQLKTYEDADRMKVTITQAHALSWWITEWTVVSKQINTYDCRVVFGFGFSLVCYAYSRVLVCFEPHYLLVVCTRDPLLRQCVYVLFWSHSPVSTPTFFDCFRVYAVSTSASFHLVWLDSELHLIYMIIISCGLCKA